MSKILLAFLCIFFSQLSAIDPAPVQNFLPVVIVNNTGLNDPAQHKLYLLVKGLDPNGVYCFLKPDTTTGICSYLYPTPSGNPSSADASVVLTDLPVATNVPSLAPNGGQSYIIYLPVDISTRAYLSVDSPLYMETVFTAGDLMIDIADPSVASYSDPNTYTLYQDFELGISNSNGGVDSSLEAFVDVTYVDYFCIPVQLYSFSYPSNDLIAINNTSLPSGIISTLSRKTMLQNMATAMQASNNPSWEAIVFNFYQDPYSTYVNPYSGDYSKVIPVRYLAAKNSLNLGTSDPQFNYAPSTPNGSLPMFGAFSSTYATSSFGNTGPSKTNASLTYMGLIYNAFNTPSTFNPFYFLITPAGGPYIYQMTSTATNLQLQFTPVGNTQPTYTLLLENDTVGNSQSSNGGLTTEQLLSGSATWPYMVGGTPTNDHINIEISKCISALFNCGNLPLNYTTGSSLTGPCANVDKNNFPICTNWSTSGTCPFPNLNCGYSFLKYFNNPVGATQGIWYNLYCQTLHTYMLSSSTQENCPTTNPCTIPCTNGCVNNNPTLGLGYAYDYDDLLGMSGTVALFTQDQYGDSPTGGTSGPASPYIVFVFGQIEPETIPQLFANQTFNGTQTAYNVHSDPAPNGVTVTYTYYDAPGSMTPLTKTADPSKEVYLGSVYASTSTPFLMTFSFTGGGFTYNRTFQLDLQHQIAVPYTNGTAYPETSFSYIDSFYQSGIKFSTTESTSTATDNNGSPPAFTIGFNSDVPPWAG